MDLETMRNARDLTPIQEKIVDCISSVIDPELGIDILNLGLVYRADLNSEGALAILMTLTTPMCPLADVIIDELNLAFKDVSEVKDVEVTLTFDPPWSLEKLSRYAKIALGVL
ncbi:metal-sulfur cluster assembly factor [Facklamia sp. DSM 111018]|uniref:Metal-sulfur cluster assembly factor n=1 Tax=Facklamia lactis TaxID=2749967 RepID=A0ABS0LPP3_9LACT|nr:metal-sulfur cluster assembly factor [Facklamia lactis]MBG9985279.1 metal-sulfur cluster assembly factor [Facklamia lactis]